MKKLKSNKDLILDLFNLNHLLNAQNIVNKLKSKMDRATVYRNLNRMVKDGILKELHLEKGLVTYELSTEDHQHFICKNCDKVLAIDIDSTKINSLLNSKEFIADDIELNISGICKDCK